jgi:hypothetical protein
VNAAMEGLPAENGAMGIHYFRPDLLGLTGPPNPRVNGTGTYTDFNAPAKPERRIRAVQSRGNVRARRTRAYQLTRRGPGLVRGPLPLEVERSASSLPQANPRTAHRQRSRSLSRIR